MFLELIICSLKLPAFIRGFVTCKELTGLTRAIEPMTVQNMLCDQEEPYFLGKSEPTFLLKPPSLGDRNDGTHRSHSAGLLLVTRTPANSTLTLTFMYVSLISVNTDLQQF